MLPVAAVASAAPVIGKALGGLSSYDKEKDAKRLLTNERAFILASSPAGNLDAYRFLKGMSGKFGAVPVGAVSYNGIVVTEAGFARGWASGGKADEDAYAKYQQLAPRYEALENAGPSNPLPGEVVDPTNIGKAPTVASVAPLFLGLVIVGLLAALLRRPSAAGA